MRIISGAYRGVHLRSLQGATLRPTSDQMRQTLFDVLGPAVAGSRFLDLYAGSGAVGIEALSRGAREVVLIESHRNAVRLIGRNLETLGVASQILVLGCAVARGLEKLGQAGAAFEHVFLDPPYAEIAEYHRCLRQLGRSPLVLPGSMVIAEHSRHIKLEEGYGALVLARSLRHGDSQLSFYRQRPEL